MVFIKFHNMNRKKKFLMSPLNSNSKKIFFSLYNKSKQCYNHSSKTFSFLFFFFSIYVLSIKKMFVLSLFFFFHMLCSTMFKFILLFFFFPSFFYCPVRFCFCFHFFFFFFFHNKLLIQCPLFFSTLYLPLCLYLKTITIGSLPSLFNFSL